MTRLQPYPAYGDSGVEWLGTIPEHWCVVRGKKLFRCIDIRSATGEEELLTVSSDRGVVPRTSATVSMFKAKSYVGHKLCWPGDLVINSLWAWSRGLGVSKHHGIVSTAYGVYRVRRRTEASTAYVHALVRSTPFRWELRVRSKGIWISRLQMTDESFLGAPFPLPPIKEQTAIAHFLDHADRRIQRSIRAKERLIELLEEQKQAIIHQAVTGQIDVRTGQAYPAYKDSEVEWLGDIPAHWERCRLRNVVSEVTTGSRGWSRYAADTGPLFVRVANLSRGSLEMRFNDVVRLDLPSTSETARTRIKEEDLLLSVTAYIGSVAVAPVGFEEAYVSQHVARCEPRSEICSRWLGYVLLSRLGQVHGQMSLYGGTKDGLSLDDVKNYPIVVPPRDEQDRLVRWIECEVSLLGELRDQAQRQIALLREYRTRLIADVVTGKLDVREAAARLLDAGAFAGGSRGGTIHTESNLRASKGDNCEGGNGMTDWHTCPAVERNPRKTTRRNTSRRRPDHAR